MYGMLECVCVYMCRWDGCTCMCVHIGVEVKVDTDILLNCSPSYVLRCNLLLNPLLV